MKPHSRPIAAFGKGNAVLTERLSYPGGPGSHEILEQIFNLLLHVQIMFWACVTLTREGATHPNLYLNTYRK